MDAPLAVIPPLGAASTPSRSLAPCVEQQRPRPPQMHEQMAVAGETHVEVLAEPRQPLNRRTAQLGLDRAGGLRSRPPRIEDLHIDERAPLKLGRKLTADRLYLGELGHALNGSARGLPISYKRAPGQRHVGTAGQPLEH